ncbi:MarC family protein [Comamonas faecalis]|uniref:UPF0056 membrane protein n=1 Tax=Comamonas faecalis TaxID=1387849 RepID=A0ABP7REN8_9BURK
MENIALPLLAAFGKSLLFVLAGILPIINPLASAPIFVDMTRGLSDESRAHLSMNIGKHVFVLIVAAMLLGSHVLHFFGVSLPVVRVAGGLIVASIAWRMLNAQQTVSDDATQMAQSLTEEKARIKAFYPLTFPLTCGPGTIAVAIALGASLRTRSSWTLSMANVAGGLVAALLLGLLIAVTFRYANQLLHRLGDVGQIVFLRLMAFILLAVGVEIVWDGVQALLLSVQSAGAGAIDLPPAID